MQNRAIKIWASLLALVLVLVSIPVGVVTAQEAELENAPPVIAVSELYVTEGMVFMLDASVAETVNMTEKKWTSTDGRMAADLVGGHWSYADGKLIIDRVDYSDSYLDLQITNLPTEDYTLDIVANWTGTEATSIDTWGAQSGIGFQIGPFKGEVFPSPWGGEAGKEPSQYFEATEWFYSEGTMNRKDTHDSPIYGNQAWALLNNPTQLRMGGKGLTTMTVTHDHYTNEHGDYAKYTFTYAGATQSRTVNPTAGNHKTYVPVANDQQFILFKNYPGELSMIRMYNRVLTADEQAQNHFADICSIFHVDLTSFAALHDYAKLQLYRACASLPLIASSKQTVEDAIQRLVGMKDAQTEYDKLYVQNGLSILLSAYDTSNASVALDEGKWYNLMGDGVTATLQGGAYSGSNISGWRTGSYENGTWNTANGGIGWTQLGDGTNKDTNQFVSNGILFDTTLIPAEDFTVQLIATSDGITAANGSRAIYWCSGTESNGQWTAAAGATGKRFGLGEGEVYAIGMFRSYTGLAMQAGSLADATAGLAQSGNSMFCRWYVTTLPYSEHNTDINANHATNRGYAMAQVNTPMQFAVGEAYSTTWTWDRDNTARSIQASVLVNGSIVTGNGNKQTYNASGLSKSGNFPANNAPSDKTGAASKFQLAVGMAGTVYSVRVYNRVLNDDEIKQNHFADLAAYYGLNVERFVQNTDETKNEIYTLFAAYDFSGGQATKSRLQQIIDAHTPFFGDVNGDGDIDTLDVTLLMKYMAEWDVSEQMILTNADTNASGSVTLADITLLMKHLAGESVALGRQD